MRLVLVRHGQTQWNADGRFQGRSPTLLSETGVRQARCLAQACLRYGPVALYTSPLPRTLQTAEVLSEALGLPVQSREALQETNLGELEGLTYQEFRERFPEVAALWTRDPGAVTFPGGESLPQVQARAWQAVQEMRERHHQQAVVAVSHSFVIRALVSRILELPLSHFRSVHVDLASLTVLEVEPQGGRVLSLNDCCHLG